MIMPGYPPRPPGPESGHVCPDCGTGGFSKPGLGRHKGSRACKANVASRALRAEGFVPLPTRLELAYVRRLQDAGIAVKTGETYNNAPGAEPRFKTKSWAPDWASLILVAEPLLPETRTVALARARGDEELQRALSALLRFESFDVVRVRAASLLRERFG